MRDRDAKTMWVIGFIAMMLGIIAATVAQAL